MITQPMRRIIEENTIGLVATVAPNGSPAVSPKATMVIVDERTIAFSDLRSPQTVRNIRLNPAVELNFIDVFSRKAARVKGRATYFEKGSARYQELLPQFAARWGNLVARMKGFVVVDVERAQLVLSPAYDDGALEAELKEQWLATYTARIRDSV